jgi:glycosyltransferase involved in cell wall biosynthesis
MRIALVQDQLLIRAGSERVFLYMAQEFREADLFTFCYNEEETWPEFKEFRIRTHPLGRRIRSHNTYKKMFPVAAWAMSHLDLSAYDLVITSSATSAKYVRRCGPSHICYCYYPTRAIWEFERYFGGEAGVASMVFRSLLPFFKRKDYAAAQRIGRIVAISQSSRDAIRRYYDRDADVLHCPVDLERFKRASHGEKKDFFLIVSRLERWKLIDYAIEAFNRLGYPLWIVGQGPDEARLRHMAKSNIHFVGGVDDETLARLYGEAKAIVFTPELEYGMVPVEAIAAGTPVIALGRGGVLETMVGLNDKDGRCATGVLFPDPTASDLIEAVQKFERHEFPAESLLEHAASFGIPAFQRELRAIAQENVAQRGHSKA